MARKTRICVPIISMALGGASILGCWQFAGAVPAELERSSVLIADLQSDSPAGGGASTAAPAAAADQKPAQSATTGGTTSAAAEVKLLKEEEIKLRRMGETIKRTHRAGLDLIGECMQPVEMVGELDMIGNQIIPIMPQTAEGFTDSYMPPRPKYIKLHMDQLAALIPILEDEIDKIVIADELKAFADQPMKDITGYMDDLKRHFKTLKSLTRTSDYDQVAITSEARGIDSCCKGMDAARKILLRDEKKTERQEEKLQRAEEKKK